MIFFLKILINRRFTVIREEVITVIENYEPRVDIIEVIVKPNYDEGRMDVSIQYEVVGINVPATGINVILEPTSESPLVNFSNLDFDQIKTSIKDYLLKEFKLY